MIRCVSRELVVMLQDRQLAEHGGGSGIRDENPLKSALARPQQLLAYSEETSELNKLAASMYFRLARNHPFVDANKRTAILTCELFLILNNVELTVSDTEIYPVILSLAESHLPEAEFAQWLRDTTQTVATSVQEPSADYSVKG
ncbi:MAG: death-on-curing protein [Gammaproteobacteria bacterium]|jgi:death-on-curing protein